MLINLSNHPLENWSEKQLALAKATYTQIIDVPFPTIDPNANSDSILLLAKRTLDSCKEKFADLAIEDKNNAIHIMGELSFVYAFVQYAHKENINCIVSTTKRNTSEDKNGKKISFFQFESFRAYPEI